MFELAMNSGLEDDTTDILVLVDTEEKQLQAIEDLYKILLAQPKYADIVKRKEWGPDTSPVTILTWLLKKAGALANGEQWLIDAYQERKKTRYRMITFRGYAYGHLKGGRQHLELNFLPYLLKKDEPLHNLIIDVVALVSRENMVPLWDEDGDYSQMLQAIEEEAFLSEEMYKGRYETYIKGPAAGYLSRIKARRETVTAKEIQENLKRYNDNSIRKRSMVWWIKNGIEVAATKRCIMSSTYIPSYEDASKIFTPFHSYKFVWSRSERDPLYTAATRKMDSLQGSFRPVEIGVTHAGQVYRPVEPDVFPELIDYFMQQGIGYFKGTYKDYYYKKLLKDLEEPKPHSLLDVFVDQEVDIQVENQVRIRV